METISLSTNTGQSLEIDHWWFDHGTPVRRVAGGSQFVKDGEQWTQSPFKP